MGARHQGPFGHDSPPILLHTSLPQQLKVTSHLSIEELVRIFKAEQSGWESSKMLILAGGTLPLSSVLHHVTYASRASIKDEVGR